MLRKVMEVIRQSVGGLYLDLRPRGGGVDGVLFKASFVPSQLISVSPRSYLPCSANSTIISPEIPKKWTCGGLKA
jgi:hypothetical protein